MSIRDAAAERRARIREYLRNRTQDQPLLTAKEIVRLLGAPRDLDERTVQRDMQAIRGELSADDKCRSATLSDIPKLAKSSLNIEV